MWLPLSVRRLCAVLILALGACTKMDLPGPGDGVASVGITLGFPGHVSDAFLTVGDQDTVLAQAFTGGWPSHTKYDSQIEPRRFAYSSSVASDAHRRIGISGMEI